MAKSVIGQGVPINFTASIATLFPSYGLPANRVNSLEYITSFPVVPSSLGIYIQVSNDDINWSDADLYSITTPTVRRLQTGARFFRVYTDITGGTCNLSVNCLPATAPTGITAGSGGNLVATDSISVGPNPAQSGAIRMTDGGAIRFRHPNGSDYDLLKTEGSWPTLGNTAIPTQINGGVVQFQTGASLSNMGNVAIGSNPAQSGALRLANNEEIKARNATNTGDVRIIMVANDNGVYIGGTLVSINAPLNLGDAVKMGTASYLQMTEIIAPTAPPADKAHLFLKDNGSGKTQLMIQFATGAAIQLAIQL